ncbi:MAG TPA: hypothetical protein VK698_37170 [Kofleriaceae bacterium]|nr:hypothetical protein [Kofleriaceae bacterium]
MADHEGRHLRRQVVARVRGRGKRYPEGLRRRVTAWARQRRDGGASLQVLSKELGLSMETVRRWTATARDSTPARTALVPVEVIEEPTARLAVVVSPSGFRLEGLTLDEAVAVLARLG